MQRMRKWPYFEFDGVRLVFYRDASCRTFMQRRTLRPLLETLRETGITYLQAERDGKSATLRTKDDLPHFLSQLGLDPVDFPY